LDFIAAGLPGQPLDQRGLQRATHGVVGVTAAVIAAQTAKKLLQAVVTNFGWNCQLFEHRATGCPIWQGQRLQVTIHWA
jgi:hypothetical protein